MDDTVTGAELLQAWRDAVRAAELAERLAALATDAAGQADTRAFASTEIADLADRAAAAATRAAERGPGRSPEAAMAANSLRQKDEAVAQATAISMRGIEVEARDAYHRGEAEADRAGG